MAIIEVKKVNKIYNKKQVLKDINIKFEENKIYGLLGRNGAGKTTLLNLITDRAIVDSGEITIDGENVYENDNALEDVLNICLELQSYLPNTENKIIIDSIFLINIFLD